LQAKIENRDAIAFEDFCKTVGVKNSAPDNAVKDAPKKPTEWTPDSTANDCMICSQAFTLFNRCVEMQSCFLGTWSNCIYS
jgi:hypothetical protein